ncbi:MAG: hypothetical protein B7Z54_02305, partial [Sphingobacteriales bacterium 12-47-4]
TSRDYWDLWVAKLDRCGNIEWQRAWGGSGYESARDIEQTADGGYIVLGETNSTDGGVVAGYGGTKDIWLLKLDATGNLQWQKRYGGSGLDIGNHLQILDDGSFLIAASSSSNNGDITGNHGTGGYTDGVILRINASGGMVWSKCFGGTKNEELLDFEIINNRIYLSGYANSTDGDIPPSQKNYAVWLLAIDLNGNKIYSKVYGGAQNDVAYAMSLATDGSLTLAGYTTSNDGDVSGAKGSQDYWVVNIGTNGTLNWQKVLGGTDAEYANALLTDTDGGYLIGGISYSNDGDVTGALGEGDYWVVKLDATGNMLWTENRGGTTNDHLRFMVYNPLQDEYYLGGDSDSYDGDFIDGQGETDFAVLKFKRPMRDTTDSLVCTLANFVSPLDTLLDACGYDSVYLSYRPVLLTSPFELLKKRDTIFAGESITLPSAGNGTISWDPNPSLSCTTCPNPIATPTVTTVYRANNSLALDCSVSDQFTVVVLNEAVVHIPTAFTPNGDGKNDFFGPIGKVPEGYSMQVYNRNGELVFKSQTLYDRWDGVFRGKPQPVGVFIYYVKYLDLQNKMHQEKGTLVLIR